MNPFVLIVGPTASGKSALALELAEEFGGVILNCDSIQIYQRLDIGAAKPSPAEMARVPHFLFDELKPGEVLTAADFRERALKVLARELPRRIVFGVGGSGFYIQALEKGMFDVPKPSPALENEVRERARQVGSVALHAELAAVDPECAEELNPNDSYRIQRALIIIRQSGRKLSELRREFRPKPFPYPLLKLGLLPPREALLPRVRARARAMLQQGLLTEVERLRAEGFGDWPALQSVGYREAMLHLEGKVSAEALEDLIVEKTMQLSKKQKTWFKRDVGLHSLPLEHTQEKARQILGAFLDRCE